MNVDALVARARRAQFCAPGEAFAPARVQALTDLIAEMAEVLQQTMWTSAAMKPHHASTVDALQAVRDDKGIDWRLPPIDVIRKGPSWL